MKPGKPEKLIYLLISLFVCPAGDLREPKTDADAMETLGRLDGLVSSQ